MDRVELISKICGVKKTTVLQWYKKNNFPIYAINLIEHVIDGKLLHKNWDEFQIINNRLICKKTNQYIDQDEIQKMWIIRQQLFNNVKKLEYLENNKKIDIKELLLM